MADSLLIGLEMAEMIRNVVFQQILLAVCNLILVMVCSFVQQTLNELIWQAFVLSTDAT